MNLSFSQKPVFKGLNIGTEIECLVLHKDTLFPIDKNHSLSVFNELQKKYRYRPLAFPGCDELCAVSKKYPNNQIHIQLETTYAMFEITTLYPVKSLYELNKLHKTTLLEFRECIQSLGYIIWPFGVAPYATNTHIFPSTINCALRDDQSTKLQTQIEDLTRLAYISSHQVNLDVPLAKVIPTINSLYKNLSNYINKFANSKVYTKKMTYNEGRYYWWNDSDPKLKKRTFMAGRIHTFPPHEFNSFQDFFSWVFGGFGYVIRNNRRFMFAQKYRSVESFIKSGHAVVLDESGNKLQVVLERADILLFFRLCWIDFKPHFDFDDKFTVDEFVKDYIKNDLDSFFKKHCTHSWVEIRACSPHFEDNAMIIPRYFWNIFKKLDDFILDSRTISWEVARKNRDIAIGYKVNS